MFSMISKYEKLLSELDALLMQETDRDEAIRLRDEIDGIEALLGSAEAI